MAANFKVSVEHYESTESEQESWGFKLAFSKKGYETAEEALDAAEPFYRDAAKIDGGPSWGQLRFNFAETHDVSVRAEPVGAHA